MKIVWLPLAQQDLVAIRLWYGPIAGTTTANALILKIVHAAELLNDNPARGQRPGQLEQRGRIKVVGKGCKGRHGLRHTHWRR